MKEERMYTDLEIRGMRSANFWLGFGTGAFTLIAVMLAMTFFALTA